MKFISTAAMLPAASTRTGVNARERQACVEEAHSRSSHLYGFGRQPARTLGLCFLVFAVAASAQVGLHEFPFQNFTGLAGITSGPDGNLWFAESIVNKIGRMTTSGTVTEFVIPSAVSIPTSITSGPDGNMWFTETKANQIGRITTSGVITEFALLGANSQPSSITSGPDGNLWFTENFGNKIGRITTSGIIMEFPIPSANSLPIGITSGPDGNLWFAETRGKIGRITPSGAITEFPCPNPYCSPTGISSGPDGNLWFTETTVNKIGRISISGEITEFALPTVNSAPSGITSGPDGNLWFTEPNGNSINNIGRITTSGIITEFALPTAYSSPTGITSGPDGNLWFTESDSFYGGDRIGQLILQPAVAQINSPTPGTQLASTAMTFTWNSAVGADSYWLDVGTALAQGNICASGQITAITFTCSGIPTTSNTSVIYVQLWTHANGAWLTPQRYTYIPPASGGFAVAQISSPIRSGTDPRRRPSPGQ
jgi:streptogramin lyase